MSDTDRVLTDVKLVSVSVELHGAPHTSIRAIHWYSEDTLAAEQHTHCKHCGAKLHTTTAERCHACGQRT